MLNPGQVADLVLAWRQGAGLIDSIPHDRPLADDMALTFRLAPPAGVPVTAATAPVAAKKAAAKQRAGRARGCDRKLEQIVRHALQGRAGERTRPTRIMCPAHVS